MPKNTNGSDSFVEDSFVEDGPGAAPPQMSDAPAPKAKQNSPALDFLLNAAGIPLYPMGAGIAGLQAGSSPEAMRGVAGKPDTMIGHIAEAVPTVGAGILGTMAGGPGLGMAAAGAARSVQNAGQVAANTVSPGSAREVSPLRAALEPAGAALAEGAVPAAGAGIKAAKGPAAQFISADTGVKLKLVQRALDDIAGVFSSKPVREAGEEIGKIAANGGLKTGTEGYKVTTASLLGAKAATDEFSTGTSLAMAKVAREAGHDALSPQEMYSVAEGLRKAMAAPKYADPHGPLAQNFKMYAQQLADLEDRLEKVLPGYAEKRAGYAKALANEAFRNVLPVNKGGSTNRLGPMMATVAVANSADMSAKIMTLGLMSPLLMRTGMIVGSKAASSGIPQALTRLMGQKAVTGGGE